MTDDLYIVTTVPESHVDAVLDAIASAGGGQIGSYTHCAFTNTGRGRFKPAEDANPHVGMVGQINAVDEWRIETFCARSQGRSVVDAIRAAHPYEQPVIYVIPLLDIDAL
ncbi:MAG: hypothetical protein IPM16_12235 [Chloroflexi bacterium]|nr:hypothetical protein [Chloroflexota bacterium]